MNRLKELRKEKKLTQQELADYMQITRRGYQKWENGESQIKAENAEKLANYFGVSVGYLLGYSDFKNVDFYIEEGSKKKYTTFEELKKIDTQLKEYRKKLVNYDSKSHFEFIKLLNQKQHEEIKKMLDATLGKIENKKISKADIDQFSEFVEWINNNFESSKNNILERINDIRNLIELNNNNFSK